MTGRSRIAILAHGHPELSTGGAEQASYALFLDLKTHPEFEPIHIAPAHPSRLGHAGYFASFRGRRDEILWAPPAVHGFRMVSLEPDRLKEQVCELFSRVSADIVHMHHYVRFGTDIFRIIKEETGLPIVLTLHEYLAICENHGQMVKTNDKLCYASSYSECSACFSGYSSGKFFLRKQLILENLQHVDLFVSPSNFLAERYIDWGVPADRIRIVENPLMRQNRQVTVDSGDANLPGPEAHGLTLGFFGQMTPFKGIEVLLSAMEGLDASTRSRVKLVLFGANLELQTTKYQDAIAAKLKGMMDCVVVHGPYRNGDVIDLMRTVDWVVVPSIWWENSPIVIQEAKAARVPVLCSNIGGMREKVTPGISGAHFAVGNSADLAQKISAICDGRLTVAANADQQAWETRPTDTLVALYKHVLSLAAASPAVA